MSICCGVCWKDDLHIGGGGRCLVLEPPRLRADDRIHRLAGDPAPLRRIIDLRESARPYSCGVASTNFSNSASCVPVSETCITGGVFIGSIRLPSIMTS